MCLFVFENHFICYLCNCSVVISVCSFLHKSNRDILCANIIIIIIRKIILGKIYDVKLFHYLKN